MGAPAGHGELNQDKPILVVDEASGFGILLGDVFHAVDVALMEQLGVTRMICAAKRCRLPSVEHSRQARNLCLLGNAAPASSLKALYFIHCVMLEMKDYQRNVELFWMTSPI